MQLPDWVCWIAQDRNGACWGFEVEPNQSANGWYENEVGRCVQLDADQCHHFRVRQSGTSWQMSLSKVR